MISISSLLSVFAMDCKTDFLGILPPWNKYLEHDDACNIRGFELADVWLIAAAVLEMLIIVGGVVAVIFVIWGGFRCLTSQGNPDATKSARRTIIYALTGLAVTIVASTTVSFILGEFIGTTNDQTGLPNPVPGNPIETILNVVYGIAGAVAALMVVIGAFQYVTSTGDPQKASGALSTIIYALVGLVVVVFATILTGAIIGQV